MNYFLCKYYGEILRHSPQILAIEFFRKNGNVKLLTELGHSFYNTIKKLYQYLDVRKMTVLHTCDPELCRIITKFAVFLHKFRS